MGVAHLGSPAPKRRPRALRHESSVPCVVLFNKPYGVVCQFSVHPARPTLKQFIPLDDVYPAGRLDWDSEGLVVLTADGGLQHRISDPAREDAEDLLGASRGRSRTRRRCSDCATAWTSATS